MAMRTDLESVPRRVVLSLAFAVGASAGLAIACDAPQTKSQTPLSKQEPGSIGGKVATPPKQTAVDEAVHAVGDLSRSWDEQAPPARALELKRIAAKLSALETQAVPPISTTKRTLGPPVNPGAAVAPAPAEKSGELPKKEAEAGAVSRGTHLPVPYPRGSEASEAVTIARRAIEARRLLEFVRPEHSRSEAGARLETVEKTLKGTAAPAAPHPETAPTDPPAPSLD
jgi:hypothetical protein